MMRFWHISPVATPIGPWGVLDRAFRIAAWPRMSSGDVGSSMNHGLNSDNCCIHSMASGTDHIWFASTWEHQKKIVG